MPHYRFCRELWPFSRGALNPSQAVERHATTHVVSLLVSRLLVSRHFSCRDRNSYDGRDTDRRR